MSSSSCFTPVFLFWQFFLWMWKAFFLISPSALFWVFALQLLVENYIKFNCTTLYQSLYTMFFWFCSFHSASVPGDFPSSHRISPFHYSFQHSTHRSIPSPPYTTICSAIPQLKGIPSFSNFFKAIVFNCRSFFVSFLKKLAYHWFCCCCICYEKIYVVRLPLDIFFILVPFFSLC